jgi:predicted Zn-ribbon and HTH transcriptional regulator
MPIGFNELVAACHNAVSRGTVARILADMKRKGLVEVSYNGVRALYTLSSYGMLLTSPETFRMWLHLGMPRLDQWSVEEAAMILCDLGAVFMLDYYPYHLFQITRREYPEIFMHRKLEKDLDEVQVHDLWRLLAEHVQGLSGEIDRRIRTGIEISEINKFISAHSSFVYDEAKALAKINYLLINNKLCKDCFRKHRLVEIGRRGICPECKKEVEPASDVLNELREWLHSGGKRIYIEGLIIYIPA